MGSQPSDQPRLVKDVAALGEKQALKTLPDSACWCWCIRKLSVCFGEIKDKWNQDDNSNECTCSHSHSRERQREREREIESKCSEDDITSESE